jgi:type I restriction enzyme S subunit
MTEGNGEVRELPKGWLKLKLEDVAEWGSGGTPSRKNPSYFNGDIPWIKTGELREKYIRHTEEKITEEAVNESSAKIFSEGCVAIAMYGATIGKISILAVEASTNQACAVAKPFDKLLFNEFLYYYLSSQTRRFIDLGKGGAQPNISQGILKNYPINLPPLAEQHRIVEKIEELFSELDQGIENLKTAQKQLKVYRQAVLKWAFEGKLTEQWRQQSVMLNETQCSEASQCHASNAVMLNATQCSEASQCHAIDGDSSLRLPSAQNDRRVQTGEELLAQIKTERENRYEKQVAAWEAAVKTWEANGKPGKKPSKPSKPKDLPPLTPAELAELPQLPDSWCWARVNQLGDVQLGRQRAPKHHTGDYMRPYLRVANVFENRIDVSDILEMNFTPEEFKTYELKYGDVLLNEGQSLELVGRSAIYKGELPGACFQNTLVRFRPSSLLNSEFCQNIFLYYFHSGRFQKIAKWTTSIAHLGAERFAELEFPLPPVEEQAVILEETARIQSLIENLNDVIETNLRRVEALRQSILKQAFEGKLVPQDPNDEPAEKLLERIRAEKTKRQPKR